MRDTFILVLCLLFAGCREDFKIKYSVNEKKQLLKDSFELYIDGEKIFELDSVTVPTSESIYYYDKNDEHYLTFYNKPSKSLNFYNDSGRLAFKIKLEDSAKNVSVKAQGHYVHSLDSIFVFDQWAQEITLLDQNGLIKTRYKVPTNPKENIYTPALSASTVCPWILLNGKLFGTGFTLGEMDDESITNRPVFISFDLTSQKVEYFQSYPDIYQQANWGGYNYRALYSTIDSNNIIVSFPADHYVYKVNLLDKTQSKYYFGSKSIDTISSIEKPKSVRDKWAMNEYFGSNPSYSSIIYDKYRKIYYRIVDHPINDYNEGIKQRSVKPFSIAIMNNQMVWIGETKVPHLTHSRIAYFVSKDGLNLRKYEPSEDRLTFSVFKLRQLD